VVLLLQNSWWLRLEKQGEENTIADDENSGSMPIVSKWLMPSPG